MVQITITQQTRERLKKGETWNILSHSDLGPLRDKKRFTRAFSRTPHNFHFVLDSRGPIHKRAVAPEVKLSPRKVTVVLTQNVSRNQIPLTPWILAHRLGHCFQATASQSAYERRVFSVLDDILKVSSPAFVEHTHYSVADASGMDLGSRYWDVLANYLDTRCARQHRIINSLDVFAECVASYLIRGTVKLRQPETVTVFRDSAYDFKYDDAATLEFDAQPFDIETMQQRLNAILDEAFTTLRGQSMTF